MKFLFVGGSADGMRLEVPADKCEAHVPVTKLPIPEVDKLEVSTKKMKIEAYIKLAVKGGTDFFMLAGMTPVEGLKRWRELTAQKQPA